MKKLYDNNVLVGTSRQGPALTDAPDCTTDLQWEHLITSNKKFKDFNFSLKLVTVTDLIQYCDNLRKNSLNYIILSKKKQSRPGLYLRSGFYSRNCGNCRRKHVQKCYHCSLAAPLLALPRLRGRLTTVANPATGPSLPVLQPIFCKKETK